MSTAARRPAGRAAAPYASVGLSLVLGLVLMLAAGGTALADEPGTGPTQGPITLSPEEATYVCTQRIPAILARIDRVTTRAGADAATRGSTAWLQARRDLARQAGRTDLADRVQRRIDERPAKLARLAELKKRATDFRDQKCGR